jgi:hypothetical protein
MDDHDGADAIERAWRDGLKPDPLLTVSEWADNFNQTRHGCLQTDPGFVKTRQPVS